MPPIEFAFYFFRFIPPMGGRRVFTKMIQRHPKATNSLFKYSPNQTFFLLVAPCGAHVTVNLPLRGARRRVPSNVPLGGADSGGHAFPPPDGILGRQVREHRRDSKPGVPPKQDSAKPTRPPRPIPPKRALSSPAPALPSLTPTLRTAPPSPAQPNPAQPSPAQSSPVLPRFDPQLYSKLFRFIEFT